MTETIAFLGVGVMGETLLAGVLAGGTSPGDVLIAERRPERAAEVARQHGVSALSAEEAAARATVIVVSVKPQDVRATLSQVQDSVRPNTLVVSVAAGVSTAVLERNLPRGCPVVRVMPNTPALVGQGMAAISPGAHCSPEHVARAKALLAATGDVIEVPEYQQDAVTAVSGSGPAYVFYVVDAMIEAGVLLGLPRPVATRLAVQTLLGAATMLKETGTHPVLLREQVSSPAGTTIAALRTLDAHGVRAAVVEAMIAARDRSAELSSD
ncbi:MAG: pyrroline-5-carboxylate reductase [Kineosporiaceae bacterium]